MRPLFFVQTSDGKASCHDIGGFAKMRKLASLFVLLLAASGAMGIAGCWDFIE